MKNKGKHKMKRERTVKCMKHKMTKKKTDKISTEMERQKN